MTKTVTTINGRLVERNQAKISVFDNTLLYADGLFETLLAIDDQLVLENEHLTRLYRGAKQLGLDMPVSRQRLSGWMHRTVKAHPSKIKKLRLTVTSGEAARWVGSQGKQQIILSASPHKFQVEPFELFVSDLRVDHLSPFRRLKTTSCVIHAAALRQAKARGYHDALLLNECGQVAETTSANIFWISRGKLMTPLISAGCLDGVTRRLLLRLARTLGLNTGEETCTMEELFGADELLITSSLKLVAPVWRIRHGRRVLRIPCGPVTRLLSEQLAAFLGL
ncbi:MAG: aminotransferase class IV [Candidatus Zixiibacteriota bacterium]